MSDYKDRKYSLREYDSEWLKQFENEAKTLQDIFGSDAISIEHVGSTAVVGMYSKPVIDILLCVNKLNDAKKHSSQMISLGYKYLVDYVMPDSLLFRKMQGNINTLNIHIFQKDHPHVNEMIRVRDYLREHPKEVNDYSVLKRELYQQYPEDYETYRKLKDEYMANLMRRASVAMSLIKSQIKY